MPKLSFYLKDDLCDRLQREAQARQVTVSRVIQDSLKLTLPLLPTCPQCGQPTKGASRAL